MAEWLKLFQIAVRIIDKAEALLGSKLEWSIGGGAMLHRANENRYSDDIDIFFTDPQYLHYLSPRLNDVAASYMEGSAAQFVEQSNYLKFVFGEGEVDFIVAPRMTRPYARSRSIGGRSVMVETTIEILAKKVYYRAEDFTARDVFDLALFIEIGEATDLMYDKPTYMPKLQTIVRRLRQVGSHIQPAFAKLRVRGYEPTFEHCVEVIETFVAQHQKTAESLPADDYFSPTTRAAQMDTAISLREQAAAGGLRFEVYLPPGMAEWVLKMVEDGTFHDPSHAVSVLLKEQQELELHSDLRQEILRRSLLEAEEGPTVSSEEVLSSLRAKWTAPRPEPAEWKKKVHP